MKTLLLLRHAKSDRGDQHLPDRERPLNTRGRRDAPRMARLLRDENLIPDLVITSTARRARQTAEGLTDVYTGDIVEADTLYLAAPDAYLTILAAVPADHVRILVIGHNPGLEELLVVLTGTHMRLPTAALARVDLPITSWRELTAATEGQLVAVWRPKELA